MKERLLDESEHARIRLLSRIAEHVQDLSAHLVVVVLHFGYRLIPSCGQHNGTKLYTPFWHLWVIPQMSTAHPDL